LVEVFHLVSKWLCTNATKQALLDQMPEPSFRFAEANKDTYDAMFLAPFVLDDKD
jgi:hypothetical protein